jgi:hypothetical protein
MVFSPGAAVGAAVAVAVAAGVGVGVVLGFVHPATIAAMAIMEMTIVNTILLFTLSPYDHIARVYLLIVKTTNKIVAIISHYPL